MIVTPSQGRAVRRTDPTRRTTMKSFVSRLVHRSLVPLAAIGLGFAGAHALAQQMSGPRTSPPSEAEVKARTATGGYHPKQMKNPNLSGHPARLTETPLSEIPVDKIKVPKGFKVEVWAHGMPGVRMMARGSRGTIWAGTRTIGRVYEIKDNGKERTHRILAQKLTQPNGVAFQGGNLYVMAINRVFRYEASRTIPTSSR